MTIKDLRMMTRIKGGLTNKIYGTLSLILSKEENKLLILCEKKTQYWGDSVCSRWCGSIHSSPSLVLTIGPFSIASTLNSILGLPFR